VRLLVIPSHAIHGGAATGNVGAIQRHPCAGFKIVNDMPPRTLNRRLRERPAVEEISIVGEIKYTGGEFRCPRAPSLRNTKFGSERPTVVAEIEQFAVVVLPQRGRHLQAHSDYEVLLVVRKLF